MGTRPVERGGDGSLPRVEAEGGGARRRKHAPLLRPHSKKEEEQEEEEEEEDSDDGDDGDDEGEGKKGRKKRGQKRKEEKEGKGGKEGKKRERLDGKEKLKRKEEKIKRRADGGEKEENREEKRKGKSQSKEAKRSRMSNEREDREHFNSMSPKGPRPSLGVSKQPDTEEVSAGKEVAKGTGNGMLVKVETPKAELKLENDKERSGGGNNNSTVSSPPYSVSPSYPVVQLLNRLSGNKNKSLNHSMDSIAVGGVVTKEKNSVVGNKGIRISNGNCANNEEAKPDERRKNNDVKGEKRKTSLSNSNKKSNLKAVPSLHYHPSMKKEVADDGVWSAGDFVADDAETHPNMMTKGDLVDRNGTKISVTNRASNIACADANTNTDSNKSHINCNTSSNKSTSYSRRTNNERSTRPSYNITNHVPKHFINSSMTNSITSQKPKGNNPTPKPDIVTSAAFGAQLQTPVPEMVELLERNNNSFHRSSSSSSSFPSSSSCSSSSSENNVGKLESKDTKGADSITSTSPTVSVREGVKHSDNSNTSISHLRARSISNFHINSSSNVTNNYTSSEAGNTVPMLPLSVGSNSEVSEYDIVGSGLYVGADAYDENDDSDSDE